MNVRSFFLCGFGAFFWYLMLFLVNCIVNWNIIRNFALLRVRK